MINQEVLYDKRKEHAHGNSLSEYDWNSGKKSCFLESVIESIIEREEVESLWKTLRVANICEKNKLLSQVYQVRRTLPSL